MQKLEHAIPGFGCGGGLSFVRPWRFQLLLNWPHGLLDAQGLVPRPSPLRYPTCFFRPSPRPVSVTEYTIVKSSLPYLPLLPVPLQTLAIVRLALAGNALCRFELHM